MFTATEIKELKEREDIERYNKIRYLIYVEKLGYEPKNGLGLEKDNYDDFSFFFGAFFRKDLVAGARLIDGRRVDLPVEKFIEFGIKENALEVSRPVQLKEKMPNLRVFRRLYLEMYNFSVSNAYQYWYANIKKIFFRSLRMRGMHFFSQVGPLLKREDNNFFPIKDDKENKDVFVPVVAKLKDVGSFIADNEDFFKIFFSDNGNAS
ncbi:MAG: hypothetical protein AAB491_02470 [Patescibacteria group bacterium]